MTKLHNHSTLPAFGPAWFNSWNSLLISQQQSGACSPVSAHGPTVSDLAASWEQLRGLRFLPGRDRAALLRLSSANSCDHNWRNEAVSSASSVKACGFRRASCEK